TFKLLCCRQILHGCICYGCGVVRGRVSPDPGLAAGVVAGRGLGAACVSAGFRSPAAGSGLSSFFSSTVSADEFDDVEVLAITSRVVSAFFLSVFEFVAGFVFLGLSEIISSIFSV